MTEPRIYRASGLGYSLEALVAPHLGFEPIDPPEFMQKAFDEGNRSEGLAIQKLWDLGWTVRERQQEVNEVGDYQIEVWLEVIPGVAKVRGHLDGVGYPPTPTAEDFIKYGGLEGVVEIKMMNDKSWQAFVKHGWDASGLVQKYKWQQSCYLLASHLPAHYMVAWNKDTEELHIEATSEPFYSISDIANKLAAAEDYIARGVIPDGCTDFPCPYFYLHQDAEEPELADSELDTLLTAWQEANRKKKVYSEEADALRDMIKEYVGESIAGKVKGSNGVVVSTNWVEEKEVSYVKAGHWETRITSPRKGKDGS